MVINVKKIVLILPLLLFVPNVVRPQDEQRVERSCLDLIHKNLDEYRSDPENFDKKIDTLSTCITALITKYCSTSQCIEIARFKSKNKDLFQKLGRILLASVLDLDVQSMDLTEVELERALRSQDIIRALLPEAAILKLATSSASSSKSREVEQKIAPIICSMLNKMGLSKCLDQSVLKKKIIESIDKPELEAVYTFVTKKNGGFEKMTHQIDDIVDVVIQCLS